MIGIAYTIVGTVGMPPHDYGALIEGMIERNYPSLAIKLGMNFPYATILWGTLITLGLLFMGLAYFIYYEYRVVLYFLSFIYLLRTLVTGRAVFLNLMGAASHSAMTYIMFLMILPIFYLLIRATFDLKP